MSERLEGTFSAGGAQTLEDIDGDGRLELVSRRANLQGYFARTVEGDFEPLRAFESIEETGLYYHGARYYAAWLGRWTAADPNEKAGAANQYRYVSNNPIGLRDPNGEDEDGGFLMAFGNVRSKRRKTWPKERRPLLLASEITSREPVERWAT